jgi:Trypsin-like peptidase domain
MHHRPPREEPFVRLSSVVSLGSLIATGALAAQQAAPTPVSLETIRKAVVTVHALDASGEALASGTGFFILPSGLVVTAAHVLEGAAGCSIEMSDGQTQRCSVAASDTAKDVLMLMVSGTAPAMLRWGSSDAAHDGDQIRVVSNPLGQLPGTLSQGIISASRVVGGTKLLQISAPISHGSSGAPLLNARGEVIGVIRSTIEAGQSLNFATATDVVRNMQNDPVAVREAQGLLQKPAVATRMEPATPTSTGSGRDIAVGQSVNGELTSGDEIYSDTTYYQFWHLTSRAGQTVTIDLSSDDFDPVLIVRGAADTSLVNDDGGPGCASRIVFTARGSGPFTILVNTTNSPIRQTGRFTLSTTAGALPVDPPSTRDCHPASQLPAAGELHGIGVGQTVNGQLTTADPLYPDTTYYQRWQFTARPGQDITIDLASSDFDPVLIVRGAADTSLINDDGGPGCASRVVFTASGSGPVTILVNTTNSPIQQTGRFVLSVSPDSKPVDQPGAGDCPNALPSSGELHAIGVEQTVNGQLTTGDPLYPDTTYYQRWQFTARPGQDITIDLSSSDFDPILIVRGAADSSLVNDDGGPGCASRVVFTAPGSGPFTILVNTTATPIRQTGRFTLSVSSGRKPVDPPGTRDCRP